jgi:hypothetical protein
MYLLGAMTMAKQSKIKYGMANVAKQSKIKCAQGMTISVTVVVHQI